MITFLVFIDLMEKLVGHQITYENNLQRSPSYCNYSKSEMTDNWMTKSCSPKRRTQNESMNSKDLPTIQLVPQH